MHYWKWLYHVSLNVLKKSRLGAFDVTITLCKLIFKWTWRVTNYIINWGCLSKVLAVKRLWKYAIICYIRCYSERCSTDLWLRWNEKTLVLIISVHMEKIVLLPIVGLSNWNFGWRQSQRCTLSIRSLLTRRATSQFSWCWRFKINFHISSLTFFMKKRTILCCALAFSLLTCNSSIS